MSEIKRCVPAVHLELDSHIEAGQEVVEDRLEGVRMLVEDSQDHLR